MRPSDLSDSSLSLVIFSFNDKRRSLLRTPFNFFRLDKSSLLKKVDASIEHFPLHEPCSNPCNDIQIHWEVTKAFEMIVTVWCDGMELLERLNCFFRFMKTDIRQAKVKNCLGTSCFNSNSFKIQVFRGCVVFTSKETVSLAYKSFCIVSICIESNTIDSLIMFHYNGELLVAFFESVNQFLRIHRRGDQPRSS
ncbi:hypothetical protein ACHAW6_004224 [Cyclotella cf. meneghiniana]